MKISRQLRQNIDAAIRNEVWHHLTLLDYCDRTDMISHKAWEYIHKPACSLTDNILQSVLKAIEGYHK